jgi:hypothetical protein
MQIEMIPKLPLFQPLTMSGPRPCEHCDLSAGYALTTLKKRVSIDTNRQMKSLGPVKHLAGGLLIASFYSSICSGHH